jgi:type I site-specific restriction-modification system R (restriction) subunit
MTRLKFAGFVAVAVLIVVAIKPFNGSNLKKNVELIKINSKQNELDELRSQINQLRKKTNSQALTLEKINRQTLEKSATVASIEDLINSVQQENLEPYDSMDFEQLEQAELERAKQIISTLDDEMSNEPYDESWAPEMQETITTTLQNVKFDGTELVSVSCQTSLCRIDVEHDNSDAEEEFLHNFVPSAGYTDTEVYFTRSEEAEGRAFMTYYVSRDGQKMPVLEEI